MVKKYTKYVLLLWGGEFYRDYLKITKIFIQVFNKNINPKKFLKKENFKRMHKHKKHKKRLNMIFTNFIQILDIQEIQTEEITI